MNAQPSVTILIAAYNAGDFIVRAVESALAQTLPPLEVLVVDDASTDGTRAEVERLAALDARVRLLRQSQNGGPAVARNAGFDNARSDWIAILDADDAIRPDRLERMMNAAIEHKADIAFDNFCYYNVANDEISAPVLNPEPDIETITAFDFIDRARPYREDADYGLAQPVFRRAFLDERGLRYPPDSRHGEDFLLMAEALLQGAVCVRVPYDGYLYTDRSSGFSRTVINYSIMQDHAVALAHDPRVQAQPQIVAALSRRIAALKQLSAERRYRAMKRERRYFALSRGLLVDPDLRRLFIYLLRQKFAGRFTHG